MSQDMAMDDPQQYPPVTDNPDWMSAGNFTQEPGSLSTSPSGFSFADQRFGAFVFVVAITATIIVVFAVFLREFYYRKYGLDPCPGYWRRRRLDEQLDADRQMAEELQRRLNEEEREEERLAKRKERRVWYETFIKDYTMTAKSEDLLYAHEISGPTVHLETPAPQEGGELTRALKHLSSISSSDEEGEELDDIERGIEADNARDAVECDRTEEDAHLYLRLPVKGKDGKCRVVDAHCAICFSEYEEGDRVVWSGLECQHAFHDECILPWLSKGKKRCPVCRHWFVPGARIEDQQKEWEERLRLEAQAAGESETSEETDATDEEAASQSAGQFNAEVSSGDSDVVPPTQEPIAAQSPTLDVESGVENNDDDGRCVEIAEEALCANNKESSQEFGGEAEELTSSSRGFDSLETV